MSVSFNHQELVNGLLSLASDISIDPIFFMVSILSMVSRLSMVSILSMISILWMLSNVSTSSTVQIIIRKNGSMDNTQQHMPNPVISLPQRGMWDAENISMLWHVMFFSVHVLCNLIY